MLWINIEKQRKRRPFFKFSLAKEMPAIFEIMFGGRIGGCYIPTISIEKQRKCPHLFFLKYFWRTDGRATGGADPNATRNWRFVETDGVYFSWLSDAGGPAGRRARLDKQKYFIGLFISTVSNALD